MVAPGRVLAIGATAEIVEYGPGRVLKWFRSGWPRQDAEAEAGRTRSARRAGLSVPATEEVIEVQGRLGIVFERVDGPSMLQELLRFPWPVARSARLLADLQVGLHRQRAPELPPRKAVMARRIREVALPAEAKGEVLQILEGLPDGDRLLHGDFHPGNVLLSPRGPVIIDWMDAMRGDPLADLARTLLLIDQGGRRDAGWLFNRVRARFRRILIDQYRRGSEIDLDMLAAWRRPTAAARLVERVPAEEPALRAIAEGRHP